MVTTDDDSEATVTTLDTLDTELTADVVAFCGEAAEG